MSLGPGARIDRYKIVEALGRGGMGEVYRARDERLQRDVALKVVRLVGAGREGALEAQGGSPEREQMLREARAAAALDHPNVVAIHDVGEVTEPAELAGTAYLAMELVRGKPLRAFVGDASVPSQRRLRWLLDVARALAAAHVRGVVHRDVKPENVMVREDGVIKVLDFGIARRVRLPHAGTTTTGGQVIPTETSAGGFVGTPRYMSPEQMRRESLDGRTDQFSWGVVAYELLCGALPWTDDGDALGLVSDVLSKDPPPLSERIRELSPDVSALVARALSKERAARFPSMDDVVSALEPLVETATQRSASAEPVTRRRRRLWLAWTLGAVALGCAAVTVPAWRALSNRTRRPEPAALAAGEAKGCASNRACVEGHNGEAYRCRRGVCVALASEDCSVLAGPAELVADDTVWIGAMFPLTGDDATSFGRSNMQAIDLARRDFVQITGGLATGPDAVVHPIGVVSCDDAVAPVRAAHHLVDDVGAPAVVGFYASSEAIDLATSLFVPHRVVSVAALNTSPLVTKVPQPPGEPRLVWRTTYSAATTAKAIALFVEEIIEPRVRAQRGAVTARRPLRVAVVRPSNAAGLGFAHELFADLRFNGKAALDNGPDFRELTFGGADEPASVVSELVAFAPHVVVYTGYSSVMTQVLEPLESRWRPGLAYRPVYIAGSGFSADEVEHAGADTGLRRRVFATTTISTTMTNARFVVHYNETFPDKITRTVAPNSSYDAFYALAFATYALGRGPVDGPALAGAMARLVPPGRKVDVGPSGIFDGFDALRRGEHIDLDGATSPLDFDLATGEAPTDQAILCVTASATGHGSDGFESGLVYDAARAKLVGAMKCP